MIASLKKKKDLKNFTILIYIKLNLFKVRSKITIMFDTGVDKNFILYRFLLKAS
jgi:hypothetical protein